MNKPIEKFNIAKNLNVPEVTSTPKAFTKNKETEAPVVTGTIGCALTIK